jgi:nitric oxide reductase activation protein
MVSRRKEPERKVDFYDRFAVKRRDLAVIVLLDVSGSTSKQVDRQRVVDLEKRAAVILGQGLESLGDRFAVCGFSGNGRENCQFFVYKDFDDAWDRERMGQILAAAPLSSTRMGAALRHAGYRLSGVDARQRLIILVTDGQPMDNAYDPNTRYAQHDVRMACRENSHLGVNTFCISTDENSRADLEIMFPHRRFAVLPDIRKLPDVLPGAYVRLTT